MEKGWNLLKWIRQASHSKPSDNMCIQAAPCKLHYNKNRQRGEFLKNVIENRQLRKFYRFTQINSVYYWNYPIKQNTKVSTSSLSIKLVFTYKSIYIYFEITGSSYTAIKQLSQQKILHWQVTHLNTRYKLQLLGKSVLWGFSCHLQPGNSSMQLRGVLSRHFVWPIISNQTFFVCMVLLLGSSKLVPLAAACLPTTPSYTPKVCPNIRLLFPGIHWKDKGSW